MCRTSSLRSHFLLRVDLNPPHLKQYLTPRFLQFWNSIPRSTAPTQSAELSELQRGEVETRGPPTGSAWQSQILDGDLGFRGHMVSRGLP